MRDLDGRTYAGAPVTLAALTLTALQAAVAAAVSSGATGLEAAVLVGGSDRRRGRRPRCASCRADAVGRSSTDRCRRSRS